MMYSNSHHHSGAYQPPEFQHTQVHHAEPPKTHPQQYIQSQHSMHGTELIGRPIHFMSGQFAGQTIRAELYEVQKADLGRKYARVDRRPLDPPPVVLLRLFQVYNAGTERQTEKELRNYDEVQVLGLVCTVDLFPIPSPDIGQQCSNTNSPPPNTQMTFVSATAPQYSVDPKPHQGPYTFVSPTMYPSPEHPAMASMAPPTPITPQHSMSEFMTPSYSAPDTVYRIGNYPITESSKLTSALVGATFVQPASVEYQSKKSLMFVFADLAVKIEGSFILRYRVFDIFSKPYNQRDDLAIQAECYGGPFRVYSTKEFPGLQASTELTKHLARWGVRLNIRETERRRRKKGEARSSSPPYTKKSKPGSPGDSAGTGGVSDDDDDD